MGFYTNTNPDGTGSASSTAPEQCKTCNGQGIIKDEQSSAVHQQSRKETGENTNQAVKTITKTKQSYLTD